MSKAAFEIFSIIFPIGEEMLYALCLVMFFYPFMARRRRRQKLLLIFAIYMLIYLLCRGTYVIQGTFSLILTALLIALSGMLGLEKPNVFLLALLYWNAKNSSGLMTESLDFIGTRFYLAPADVPNVIYSRSAVLLTLFLLSHAALLSVMLYALRRLLQKRRLPLCRLELCYISLAPMAGILFGQMISRLLFEMKDGELLQLYERHPAFLAIVPVLAILLYAGTYLTIYFQQSMAALRDKQSTHYVEQQQIQAIQARIHEAERFYTHIRGMKHEMRGHLTNIKGLVKMGEYESLNDYIAQIDENIRDFEPALQTGNPVADVIVSDTQRRSLDLGIDFQVNFHYPENGGFDAFDIGIILQNLLQNAVEACEKVSKDERFITLTGRKKGRFFLIEVKNPFQGEVVFSRDGLPVTTKNTKTSMHGIGLNNVRGEAEKYMGELELKTNHQEFCATVLLQERSNL